MLVLDRALTSAVLGMGAEEGLADAYGGQQQLDDDPYIQHQLSLGMDPQVRSHALWDLLLHHPAVLSPFDSLHIDGLKDAGLVQGQIESSIHNAARRTLASQPEAINEVLGFVTADIAQSFPGRLPTDPVAEFVRLQAETSKFRGISGTSPMFSMFDTYEAYVEGIRGMLGGRDYELPARAAGPTRKVSGNRFVDSLLAEYGREDFEAFKDFEKNDKPFLEKFGASAHQWLALTHAAKQHKATMGAVVPAELEARWSRNWEQDRILKLAEQGGTYAAVRLVLSHATFLPRLEKIAHVVALQEHRDIGAFRQAMALWTQCLSAGDLGELNRITEEVQRTNRQLAHLKNVRQIGALYAYVSVPLDMLLASHPALGLTAMPFTSIGGFALQAYTEHVAGQLDWAMFCAS